MKVKGQFDFSQTEGQAFVVHSIRVAFLALVFFVVLAFQFLESRIVSDHAFYPIYWIIGLSFLCQIMYLVFFKSLYRNRYVTSLLFILESIYITFLIYYIGIQQSILIFLYLVNIILCGVLYQRKGALMLALWTSMLFSLIISLDPSIGGYTSYLAVGVNNLAFFTIAYLSGYLSEQLNIMGAQLEEKVRDVKTLKNLNELILVNMSSGLMTVDAQGLVVQHNPAAISILGLRNNEVLGKKLLEILPQLPLNFLESKNQGFDLNYRRENEKRLLRVHISQLADESGHRQGQVVAFQDETHLRSLEKRVRQSEKMAAIGQLAAGIAHEIRNPLAGISGSIQLLQSSDSTVEESGKLMKIVVKEIDRLNNLITEFLDFAKPEAPMEDQINVSQLVEEIVDFVLMDNKSVPVKKSFSGNKDLYIIGNRDKLKQAFLNIIVNACQAMEKSDQPTLSVEVKKVGTYALVSIGDNGMGMDEKLKERIFEPFHTTKHKGTGLGLAITHSILESHRAEIQVESEVGEGTQFNIQFNLLNSPKV